jgi:hypothetical protein
MNRKDSLLSIPAGCAVAAVILTIWAIMRSLAPDPCDPPTATEDAPYGLCACDDFSSPIEAIVGLIVRLAIFVGIGTIAARVTDRQRMLAATSCASAVAALVVVVDPFPGPCHGYLRGHLPSIVWLCMATASGAFGGWLMRYKEHQPS